MIIFLTARKVAGALRPNFGRNSVEPYLKAALKERNHRLDPFFTVKTHPMSLKKDKVTKEEIIVNKTGVSPFQLLVNKISFVIIC